jgi:hypothetical protein
MCFTNLPIEFDENGRARLKIKDYGEAFSIKRTGIRAPNP